MTLETECLTLAHQRDRHQPRSHRTGVSRRSSCSFLNVRGFLSARYPIAVRKKRNGPHSGVVWRRQRLTCWHTTCPTYWRSPRMPRYAKCTRIAAAQSNVDLDCSWPYGGTSPHIGSSSWRDSLERYYIASLTGLTVHSCRVVRRNGKGPF